MTTTKSVNPGQLQREALALSGSTHVELTLLGPTDATGIAASGATLLCSDQAGSSDTQEPCSFCVQAYGTHVAAPTPTPVPPDPLKPYRDALSSAAASDPGLDTSTKTALQNLLAAMAPRV